MKSFATLLSIALAALPVGASAQYTGPYASTATTVKALIAH
ncbi:hypothetical protein QZM97_29415 [Burkholderia orbicola]|nr:hypothetical protein [Burkholderia orbicola]MDN7994206.1 hypothetical protein [Burkholderia orbicola]